MSLLSMICISISEINLNNSMYNYNLFTYKITDLQLSSRYFVNVYLKTNYSTFYGEETFFYTQTPSEPILTTIEVIEIKEKIKFE